MHKDEGMSGLFKCLVSCLVSVLSRVFLEDDRCWSRSKNRGASGHMCLQLKTVPVEVRLNFKLKSGLN